MDLPLTFDLCGTGSEKPREGSRSDGAPEKLNLLVNPAVICECVAQASGVRKDDCEGTYWLMSPEAGNNWALPDVRLDRAVLAAHATSETWNTELWEDSDPSD